MTTPAAEALLATYLESWKVLLQQWSLDGRLAAAAQEALMLQGTPEALQELLTKWGEGEFGGLPPIQLLSSADMFGAMGAYAISTGTIYLNADWVLSANQEQVNALLTEELGHHLDGILNAVDTPGDEGEYFSKLLTRQVLSDAEKKAMRNQTDLGVTSVGGTLIAVEQAASPVIRGNSLYSTVFGDLWTEAEDSAKLLGGHLTTIQDASENTFLANTFRVDDSTLNTYYSLGYDFGFTFIGLNELFVLVDGTNGDYSWIDGSNSAYRNWSPTLGLGTNADPLEVNWQDEDIALLATAANAGAAYGYWVPSPNDATDGINPNFSISADVINRGIAELSLNASIGMPLSVKEGGGIFSTIISLSAGTLNRIDIVEGAIIYWKIVGITIEDLEAGTISGSGTIANGTLSISHALKADIKSEYESFGVAIFSDASMTPEHQIGGISQAMIQEASGLTDYKGILSEYSTVYGGTLNLMAPGARVVGQDNTSAYGYGIYSAGAAVGTVANEILDISVVTGAIRYGSMGSIDLSGGDDILQVDVGEGNGYGLFGGNTLLGLGDDRAIIYGLVTSGALLDMGGGNDLLVVKGAYKSILTGSIDLGDGNDEIYSRSRYSTWGLQNFEGITLRGGLGDDVFDILLGSGTIDGGEGFDAYIIDTLSLTLLGITEEVSTRTTQINLSDGSAIRITKMLANGSWSISFKTENLQLMNVERVRFGNIELSNEGNNRTPIGIQLSSGACNENIPAASVVATLSSTDPDAGDTFTYSLVPGTGPNDNSAFTIAGNQLIINDSPDFESKPSYSVRMRTTDAGGLFFERDLTISVNNLQEGSGTVSAITGNGPLNEGVTLTAGAIFGDPDGNGTITAYQWYLNDALIIGANSNSYAVSATGFGNYKVVLTYNDGMGFSSTVTSATQAVSKINNGNGTLSAITGNGAFNEGVTLSAGSITGDPDGNGSITTHQWYLNDAIINGATSSAYTTTATGFGNYKVVVTYGDGQGYSASVTSATQAVAKIDNGNALTSVTGSAVVGSALTAAITTADPDGNGSFSYQWQSLSNGTWGNILNATGTAYTLTTNELNKQIRVLVTSNDAQGYGSTITSTPTSTVTQASDLTPPTITDISVQGSNVILTFSETIQPTGPNASTFVIRVNGTARTVSGLQYDVVSQNKFTLTITGSAPTSTDGVTASYAGTGTNTVKDTAGNLLGTFTNRVATTFVASGNVTTLNANYANLTLGLATNMNGNGNSADNRINGNRGNNVVDGLLGNDVLTGGAGADSFYFSTTPSSSTNRDTITDFASGTDKIRIKRSAYPALSGSLLTAGQFVSGAGLLAASTSTVRFFYNTTTGILSYDRDGSGTSYAAIQIAVLGANTPLLSSDFALVA